MGLIHIHDGVGLFNFFFSFLSLIMWSSRLSFPSLGIFSNTTK